MRRPKLFFNTFFGMYYVSFKMKVWKLRIKEGKTFSQTRDICKCWPVQPYSVPHCLNQKQTKFNCNPHKITNDSSFWYQKKKKKSCQAILRRPNFFFNTFVVVFITIYIFLHTKSHSCSTHTCNNVMVNLALRGQYWEFSCHSNCNSKTVPMANLNKTQDTHTSVQTQQTTYQKS